MYQSWQFNAKCYLINSQTIALMQCGPLIASICNMAVHCLTCKLSGRQDHGARLTYSLKVLNLFQVAECIVANPAARDKCCLGGDAKGCLGGDAKAGDVGLGSAARPSLGVRDVSHRLRMSLWRQASSGNIGSQLSPPCLAEARLRAEPNTGSARDGV